jgi:hypothetical protein
MSEAPDRKRVILCADDFGLSEAASVSIVVLAGLRAIIARRSRPAAWNIFSWQPRNGDVAERVQRATGSVFGVTS